MHHCTRECHPLGQLAVAMTTYGTAGQVARASGNLIGDLRAQIGEAKILAAKGNLPDADTMLEEAAERAFAHELPEIRSVATHDRSHVAQILPSFSGSRILSVHSLSYPRSDLPRCCWRGGLRPVLFATSLHGPSWRTSEARALQRLHCCPRRYQSACLPWLV